MRLRAHFKSTTAKFLSLHLGISCPGQRERSRSRNQSGTRQITLDRADMKCLTNPSMLRRATPSYTSLLEEQKRKRNLLDQWRSSQVLDSIRKWANSQHLTYSLNPHISSSSGVQLIGLRRKPPTLSLELDLTTIRVPLIRSLKM